MNSVTGSFYLRQHTFLVCGPIFYLVVRGWREKFNAELIRRHDHGFHHAVGVPVNPEGVVGPQTNEVRMPNAERPETFGVRGSCHITPPTPLVEAPLR